MGFRRRSTPPTPSAAPSGTSATAASRPVSLLAGTRLSNQRPLDYASPVSREFEVFRIDRRGRVAIVTIDRPEKRNAMSPTFFRELPQVLDVVDADPELRAVVLTGAGEAFSAGGDIASFADLK